MDYEHIPNRPGIYVIKNIVKDKYYVGFSLHVRQRIVRHLSDLRLGKHCCKELLNDWKNKDTFSCEFIEMTEDEDREIYWIDYYKSNITGYNIKRGYYGLKHSNDTKERLRQLNKGNIPSEESRKLMRENASKYWLGKQHKKETRNKISNTLKGKLKAKNS